jgi:hypothetical protein
VGVALRLYAEDHHAYPKTLDELYAGHYLEQRSLLRCDKTGQEYFYRRATLAAKPDELLLSCVDPSTTSGKRPHRHGTVSVVLHASGEATLTR